MRRRGRTRPVGLNLAVLGVALALAGCGATKIVTQTNTVIRTDTVTRTVVHHAVAPPARTTTVTKTVKTPTPTSSATSGGGVQLSWSGNGGEHIGTIHVPVDSMIKWTNDGGFFSILDQENAVEVNSQAQGGQSAIAAGTYHGFQVNAVGNWTIHIVPSS